MGTVSAADELIRASKEHPLYDNVKKTGGKIVIYKGELAGPEYLFIGEAPGQEENIVGKPFVGRSGKILDEWIQKAGIKSYAVINAVPVMPVNQDGSIRTPTSEEISYFRPYTNAFIHEINPKWIICVGKSAAKFLELEKEFKNKHWSGKIGFIYHPSYYLRNGVRGTDDFIELIKKFPGSKAGIVPASFAERDAANENSQKAPQKDLGDYF